MGSVPAYRRTLFGSGLLLGITGLAFGAPAAAPPAKPAAPPAKPAAPPAPAPAAKPAAKPAPAKPPSLLPVDSGPVQLDLAAYGQARFNELQQQINAKGKQPSDVEVLRRDALILPDDRDPVDVVLRRTEALLADIKRLRPTKAVAPLEAQLRQVRAEAEKTPPQLKEQVRKDRKGEVRTVEVVNRDARYPIYEKICQLRRQIAFANPLLDFDQILFAKRYRRCPGHICDQFFGPHVGGGPGGSLYVLSDVFGPKPVLRNVLANSTVLDGRLKGAKLEGGSFLGPDLSFDGKAVTFAYTECKSQRGTVTLDSRQGIWDPQGAYHIFRVNADGSDLRQLTDGQWNDFDPCWLPSGRIVFISERRGGYGRCHGRPVPTYTLHSMNADGTDIVALSYHETNEWQPSVNHNGMIIYSRWDYVDRGDCIAHHPWITTPDGRDARVIHGNYPTARNARPDAELDVRAIPNSPKYVATASPHHGQSFGSFVLIDPRVVDDGAMSPLKRITPDNGFPETQGGRLIYGTAWPLSEDYYLCVYGGTQKDSVFLIDAFGNHELLYADPAIECISPIPFRPRTRPPVIPHATLVGVPGNGAADSAKAKDKPALITCVNVYDGQLPWPDGSKIKALRIIQLFPKATPSMDNPRISAWAESLARGVVGTVPVEPDGSAFFHAPPGKTLYFQALDEKGLAIQSMQSDAYFHPGEKLTCQGCHEHRYRSPSMPKQVALALRRAPSEIKPDVDGSYPLSFPRLVQPVLDRHCVACHDKEPKAPKLGGAVMAAASGRGKGGGWTPSYNSLSKLGFGRSGKPPSRGDVRTVPGQFGALASKLYALLQQGHHNVKLPPEDLYRITLWLDCNSNFFGAYHDLEGQARGDRVMPELQ
jgi:hypothetical protein